MHLRESILRKIADETVVDSVLAKYRQNNPEYGQLMRDDQVKGYIAHKNALKESDKTATELTRLYRAQGTGDTSKGSIGYRLMELNKKRAANKAIIGKFEKERGLRRESGMGEETLDSMRANMQKVQNVYANELTKHLSKEDLVEGATIDKATYDEARAKASDAAESYGKEQFSWNDMDKAERWDAYSKYLSGGGRTSNFNYTTPGMDTKMKMLAMNKGLTDDPELRAKWEQANKLKASGQFGDVKDRSHSNYSDKAQYAFAEAGVGGNWLPKLMGGKDVRDAVNEYGSTEAALKARDQGKIQFEQRHQTARNKLQTHAKQMYADKTADTTGKYAKGRKDAVTGFLKKNWMPIAGLGLGALGVMGIMGMRGRQGGGQPQQAQAVGQQKQPGVDDWAHNRNFRERGGTPQQTVIGANAPGKFDISSTFKKFMGGMSG